MTYEQYLLKDLLKLQSEHAKLKADLAKCKLPYRTYALNVGRGNVDVDASEMHTMVKNANNLNCRAELTAEANELVLRWLPCVPTE